MEDCIAKKTQGGKEIDEQALAICYSECGEAKGTHDRPDGYQISDCKDDVKGIYDCGKKEDNVGFPFIHWAKEQDETKEYDEAFLSMMYNVFKKWQNMGKPQKANIDQESLDNITTIPLPKGNGGDGYSTHVKTKKCPPNKKCDVEPTKKKVSKLSLKNFDVTFSV